MADKGCKLTMMGRAVKHNSPAYLPPIGAGAMGGGPMKMPIAPKIGPPKMPGIQAPKVPRSVPSPSRTKFRPSANKMPGQGLGMPLKG